MEIITTSRNSAYIDGANLYNGVQDSGWKIDYRKFRVWLYEKYDVGTAYIFFGFIQKYENLYDFLKSCGYTLIFRDVTIDSAGKVKGNCDADLIVKVMRDAYEDVFEKAIIITSDGDYASLVSFLIEKQKLEMIISPYSSEKCSALLKKITVLMVYLNSQKHNLQYVPQNEKAPDGDGTP